MHHDPLPEDLALPLSSINPKELVRKPRVLFLLCLSLLSEGGGPGCAAGGGSTSGPQHLICLPPRSCFFLRAGRVLVMLAARDSRSLRAASKGGRKIKGTRYNPPSHGKHRWFAVPVTPWRSSLLELCPVLCKSPVSLLAGGSKNKQIWGQRKCWGWRQPRAGKGWWGGT